MCLIFISINNHPKYKLVVAANRDEFYARKTAPATFWKDHPDVIGGRDLEAMGTWMAMTKSGKISMLTNYRDPQNINPKAPSRGQLVSDFLIGTETPQKYLQGIEVNGKAYNGFNLLVGDQDELWYYSNYKNGIEKLSPGFYGISNHLLETPWPKVKRGKEKLRPILDKATIKPEEIFEVLYDDVRAREQELPNTGLPLEREQALSSMFIKTDNYGSRCSTVVMVDHNNDAVFIERVFDLKTFQYNENKFEFKIS